MLLALEINTNYELTPHLAYLLMFDANNKKERKKFLQTIVKDSYLAYSFIKNFNPDYEEQSKAFDSVLRDVKSCYDFLIHCNFNDNERNQALKVVLQNHEYSYLLAVNYILSFTEKKYVYDKYHYFYSFTNDLTKYFEYCVIFKEFISQEEKENLVDMILENSESNIALDILNGMIDLPECLKDKLESILLIRKLSI